MIRRMLWRHSPFCQWMLTELYNHSWNDTAQNQMQRYVNTKKTTGKAFTVAFTTTATLTSESGYFYDLNGNIKKLQRKGSTGSFLDNLTYSYIGNQLWSVDEDITGDKNAGFIDGVYGGQDTNTTGMAT